MLAAHAHWPGQVVGLHIHHGLQAAADGFEAQALALGRDHGFEVFSSHVNAQARPGQSPEEAARSARYSGLAALAQAHGVACVWLAQHQDDQMESVLLALSRGAGVAGMAGMRPAFEHGGVRFERPILSVRSADIRQWLQAVGVAYCQDPSNADETLTRNRIRHQVTPALEAAFPAMAACVTRTAQHMAQAQTLLEELAEQDAASVGQPPLIKALQAFSQARQANLLRHWIKGESGAAPSQAQMQALLRQIAACQTRGHGIELKVSNGHIVRVGAHLGFQANL